MNNFKYLAITIILMVAVALAPQALSADSPDIEDYWREKQEVKNIGEMDQVKSIAAQKFWLFESVEEDLRYYEKVKKQAFSLASQIPWTYSEDLRNDLEEGLFELQMESVEIAQKLIYDYRMLRELMQMTSYISTVNEIDYQWLNEVKLELIKEGRLPLLVSFRDSVGDNEVFQLFSILNAAH